MFEALIKEATAPSVSSTIWVKLQKAYPNSHIGIYWKVFSVASYDHNKTTFKILYKTALFSNHDIALSTL